MFVVLFAIVALTIPPQGNGILQCSYDRCIFFNLRGFRLSFPMFLSPMLSSTLEKPPRLSVLSNSKHGATYSFVRVVFLAVITKISVSNLSITFGVQALDRKILCLLLIARRNSVVQIIPMIDHSL